MAVQFIDLPPEAFPFRVRITDLYARDDDEPLLDITIAEPGAFQVPCFGRPILIVIEYGDGTVSRLESYPPGSG